MSVRRKPKVGLVLGGGSALGWAHVGVIRSLERAGIHPEMVCGTSIGALVGAAYAAGELDSFEKWLLGMRVADVVGFMDLSLNGGVLKGERLMKFFRRSFVDRPIEELRIPFAAVSTSLHTGAEVWLRNGSTVEAVRASIALPALFTPVRRDGMTLVDGGLVNPVPVSLARAMGAELVIAVDLNSEILGRHLTEESQAEQANGSAIGDWIHKLQENLGGRIPAHQPGEPRLPSMLDVLASSLNIMQVRITRGRMAGDPPDVIVARGWPTLVGLIFIAQKRRSKKVSAPRAQFWTICVCSASSLNHVSRAGCHCTRFNTSARTRVFDLHINCSFGRMAAQGDTQDYSCLIAHKFKCIVLLICGVRKVRLNLYCLLCICEMTSV